MVSRYQPDPQASAASLRRAQGKLRPPAGPGRPSVGRRPHGCSPCGGRSQGSDARERQRQRFGGDNVTDITSFLTIDYEGASYRARVEREAGLLAAAS